VGSLQGFPVVGTILVTIGLYLMSHIGGDERADHRPLHGGLRASLGLVMQVLVVAVQNAVTYEELGTATSGVTLLPHDRWLLRHGGLRPSSPTCSPAISSGTCTGWRAAQTSPARSTHPKLLAHPRRFCGGRDRGHAHSIDKVFLIAVPIAFVAFLLSWLLARSRAEEVDSHSPAGRGFRRAGCPSSLTRSS